MSKILIIEDETSLLEVYADFLTSEGHEVTKASDGEEGLNIALTQEWDIMFLDVMLPKLDGLELLKRLKSENKLVDRKVIMLTNIDNEPIVSESLSLGAVEHLSKAKVTPETLNEYAKKYARPENNT